VGWPIYWKGHILGWSIHCDGPYIDRSHQLYQFHMSMKYQTWFFASKNTLWLCLVLVLRQIMYFFLLKRWIQIRVLTPWPRQRWCFQEKGSAPAQPATASHLHTKESSRMHERASPQICVPLILASMSLDSMHTHERRQRFPNSRNAQVSVAKETYFWWDSSAPAHRRPALNCLFT